MATNQQPDGAHAQKVAVVDNAGNSLVVTGPFTGQNGIRVYGGPTDPISDTPVIMDAPHHHLHEGEMHQYTYGPIAQANGTNVDFRFVVPVLTATTRTPHLALELDSTGEEWLLLYESPTTSANGTQQTVVNKNRNSTITPGSTVWLAPTVTAVGTLLSAWIVGSGEKSGSSGRESIEWALKSNTTYLVRISAKNANNVCLRLIWYEDLGV
jgi:hypothetical protein